MTITPITPISSKSAASPQETCASAQSNHSVRQVLLSSECESLVKGVAATVVTFPWNRVRMATYLTGNIPDAVKTVGTEGLFKGFPLLAPGVLAGRGALFYVQGEVEHQFINAGYTQMAVPGSIVTGAGVETFVTHTFDGTLNQSAKNRDITTFHALRRTLSTGFFNGFGSSFVRNTSAAIGLFSYGPVYAGLKNRCLKSPDEESRSLEFGARVATAWSVYALTAGPDVKRQFASMPVDSRPSFWSTFGRIAQVRGGHGVVSAVVMFTGSCLFNDMRQ